MKNLFVNMIMRRVKKGILKNINNQNSFGTIYNLKSKNLN